MVNINFRILTDSCSYSKNVLYKIDIPRTVVFVEKHGKSCEKVYLEYALQGRQFGIFAHEYRNPVTEKEGTKRADILCSLVDPDRKEIHTDIFDVKSNISAFSDDLTQDNAMMTAVKEIRDFIEQLYHAVLHKESFMLYYKAEGYLETERLGIITKNFDSEKFIAVADRLEKISKKETDNIDELILFKTSNVLRPYRGEAQKIRDFAHRSVHICRKDYKLYVFILEESCEAEYVKTIKVGEH